MSGEEQQLEMSPLERLINDGVTTVLDYDAPSLTALTTALGSDAAKKARETRFFGWDSPAKAFLKKHRPWIFAILVTFAKWAFSLEPKISSVLTFIVVYGLTRAFLVVQIFAETVDEMAGRLNVLRHMVAVYTLSDQAWKQKSGIEIKDSAPITGLDIARRLIDWDGRTTRDTKENEARWKIMNDVLNPER